MKYITDGSKTANASDSEISTLDKHSDLRRSIEGLSSDEHEAPPAYGDDAATETLPAKADHGNFKIRNPHFGRGIKDRLTHTTHEQRALDREAEAERKRRTQEAIDRAIATGERQLVGKDSTGKDVYVEPPAPGQYYNGYGYGYGYGYGGYGYNPYYGYGLGLGVQSLFLGSLLFGLY